MVDITVDYQPWEMRWNFTVRLDARDIESLERHPHGLEVINRIGSLNPAELLMNLSLIFQALEELAEYDRDHPPQFLDLEVNSDDGPEAA